MTGGCVFVGANSDNVADLYTGVTYPVAVPWYLTAGSTVFVVSEVVGTYQKGNNSMERFEH
jgi:hypothetical protein